MKNKIKTNLHFDNAQCRNKIKNQVKKRNKQK